jgi:hypothetical protein
MASCFSSPRDSKRVAEGHIQWRAFVLAALNPGVCHTVEEIKLCEENINPLCRLLPCV